MSLASAKKRRQIIVAALAAAVAVGASFFAISLSPKTQGVAPPAVAVGPSVQVVVLTGDLPAQTKITAGDLKFVSFPAAQATTDNVTEMKDAVGKVNIVPVSAGSILLKTELLSDYVTIDATRLSPGDVAVAMPFDEARGFGGYVHPEDRFDILCDSGDGLPAYYCFTDVRVLEVGGISEQPSPAPVTPAVPAAVPAATPAASSPPTVLNAKVLVVEMSRSDAAKLRGILAKVPDTGKDTIVAYALRSYTDYHPSPSP